MHAGTLRYHLPEWVNDAYTTPEILMLVCLPPANPTSVLFVVARHEMGYVLSARNFGDDFQEMQAREELKIITLPKLKYLISYCNA